MRIYLVFFCAPSRRIRRQDLVILAARATGSSASQHTTAVFAASLPDAANQGTISAGVCGLAAVSGVTAIRKPRFLLGCLCDGRTAHRLYVATPSSRFS